MSIWTPSGEHTPEPEPRPGPGPSPDPGRAPTEAELDEMREMLAQIVSTPAAAFVAQHAAQLHELALVHLSTAAERGRDALIQAELAIDAMAGIVEQAGERLGQATAPLRDALAQARMAFVEIAGEIEAAAAGGTADLGGPTD